MNDVRRTWIVECSLGTIWAEVEGDTEDEAIENALEEWESDSVLANGTFTVRETEETE